MILREKQSGILLKSDGIFHTYTYDWNNDGDIYTDSVMTLCYAIDYGFFHKAGDFYTNIRKCDMYDYEVI